MVLKIRYQSQGKKKNYKNTYTWRLTNIFLNNEQITEEIKSESERK